MYQVSTEQRDPGLNDGYAYIVGTTKFKEYLKEYDMKIPEDKSTCNNHDAIKLASMQGGKGTDATGIATAECSRHDMKRPTAMGDLQKGERHVCRLHSLFCMADV
jgi:Kyakuja-Dileera-Zisupton transposase